MKTLFTARPCFACRTQLPWPCRCNHRHVWAAVNPNAANGRTGRDYFCEVCGLVENDDIDAGD